MRTRKMPPRRADIPEEGLELQPLEAQPDPAAVAPETVPKLPPIQADGRGHSPAYGQTPASPTPSAPAVKASSVSAAPFWVAGGLLAVGGMAAAAAKGSSGSDGDKDKDNQGSDTGKTNSAATPSANGTDNTATPPNGTTPASPPPPQPNHVRLVYEHTEPQKIKGLKQWQDEMGYQSHKVSVAEDDILRQYIARHGAEKVQTNIRYAYKADTDGDGIIDLHDRTPDTWSVSDRDLRMFSTLAYKGSETLSRIFDDKNLSEMASVNADLKKGFGGQADVGELVEKWTLLKAYNGHDLFGSGLDYAIFGNGKTASGYKNIVVAFRGTSNVQDIIADAQLSLGARPHQVFDMAEKVMADLARFNPEKVYSTGHSLGGYLAQYFAAHNMAGSDKFQHSALFNPAVLRTGLFSSEDLLEARRLTDHWLTRENDLNHDDLSEPKHILKSTSFTINGEWLSNVFGSYGTTTWLNAHSPDQKAKHAMGNFYAHSRDVQEHFSQGYRTDRSYENEDSDNDGLTYVQEKHIGLNVKQNNNQTDSDRDGFSDALEVKLGSDYHNAEIDIDLRDYYTVKADEAITFVVAGTETADGTLVEAVGVELSAKVENNHLVYAPSGLPPVTLGINNAEWQQWLEHSKIIKSGTTNNDTLSGENGKAAVLYGGAGDDVLSASTGLDIMVGGAGNDTFRFSADTSNRDHSPDLISDFNTGDRLDLGAMRKLFADHAAGFKFSDILFDSQSPVFAKHSALVWQQDTQTLSYKTAHSDEWHAIVRFDDHQTLASVQAGLIG